MPASRLALVALVACGVIALFGASPARADGRYGDSTWVAPAVAFGSGSPADGPRVALPDHERRWETALRTPFRVVFLPLRLLAGGLEGVASYVGPRYFEPKANQPPPSGPVFGPYVTLDGLRDLGVGPAVTWVGFPASGAKLHLAGSWSAIDHRRVHFSEVFGYERPVGFRLRGDYDAKPNWRYYGIGNGTPETDLSYFRLTNTSGEAALLFGASPLRQVRILGGYSSLNPGRGAHALPLLEDVFTPTDAPYQNQATREVWYGVSADLSALDDGRDPSSGVHGRADLRRAAGIGTGDPDYSQWRVEGRAYVPVFAKRRVIAVRGLYAGVDPGGDASAGFPYYRLPQSEGAFRFAGYASGRFRDRQLMLGRVEYRWLVFYRLSAVALYELGAVAPRADAFTLRGAHRSYGGGLRFGLSDLRALRLEVAKGSEGIHTVLALASDF